MGGCCASNDGQETQSHVSHPMLVKKHGQDLNASFLSRQGSVMKSGVTSTNFYCDNGHECYSSEQLERPQITNCYDCGHEFSQNVRQTYGCLFCEVQFCQMCSRPDESDAIYKNVPRFRSNNAAFHGEMMPVCKNEHILHRYPAYTKFNQSKMFCDMCSRQIRLHNDGYVWHCKKDPDARHPRCIGVFYCDECVQNDELSVVDVNQHNKKPEFDELFGFAHAKTMMGVAYQQVQSKKFGVFWLNDTEVGYGYVVGNHAQALQIYNNLHLDNAISGAKILVNGQQDNVDEIHYNKNMQQSKGLQDNINFLIDRAFLSRFILKALPRPSNLDLRSYWRIYWVDEQDMVSQTFGFSFDHKKQIKLFRDCYAKQQDAESQYQFMNVTSISKLCAKILVYDGEIQAQSCKQEEAYSHLVNYMRWIAWKEGWIVNHGNYTPSIPEE